MGEGGEWAVGSVVFKCLKVVPHARASPPCTSRLLTIPIFLCHQSVSETTGFADSPPCSPTSDEAATLVAPPVERK